MSRKQVERHLPPIEDTFTNFGGFAPNASRQAMLLRTLREATQRLRGKDSIPFYSMREIAHYFGVPLRTVAIVYENLELEGLLNRIRGSKTMLVGTSIAPSKPVRALIGIPLWLHAVVVSPYSRLLHWELEERLRHCGFVADIIFFRGDEVNRPEFAERLLQHNLNYIIWHTPHPLSSHVILSLKDSGVKQILIHPSDNFSSLSLPTYYQDWKSAYRQMSSDWRANGIKTVLVPEPTYMPSQRAMKSFAATVGTRDLDVRFIEGSAADLHKAALKQPENSTVVAFLDQLGADTICNEEPVIIEQILQHCRVAFCRGPLRVPYFHHRKAQADLVRFSAREIAEKIVNDIRDNKIPGEGPIHTFKAMYEPQAAFGSNSENL
ncbi:GntR family transcriptional regulator [Puniceicoccus vermicola]|uniref:Uncharacterized protein n=1 Tax=Puniceicoccus vermicola TaxID=388746 RepID=A0A7X1E661_9BACT|nr:hypothetical protein [Puniceicoccus vermicola]MBC2603783.1 hypothetical protein [Puniceicoccus vermicola]